jgi:hypothetical protein
MIGKGPLDQSILAIYAGQRHLQVTQKPSRKPVE